MGKIPSPQPPRNGPFSEAELDAIIKAFTRARKRSMGPMTNADRDAIVAETHTFIGPFYEWAEYEVASYLPPSKQKKELERLERAASALTRSKSMAKFAQVVGSLERKIWDLIPENERRVWPNWSTLHARHVSLRHAVAEALMSSKDADARCQALLGRLPWLAEAARAAINELEKGPPARTGPQSNEAIKKLALDIAPLYEVVTSRKPGAHYNEHLGYKSGPFIPVLAAFLRPLGADRNEAQLGDLVSRLFKNRDNWRQNHRLPRAKKP